MIHASTNGDHDEGDGGQEGAELRKVLGHNVSRLRGLRDITQQFLAARVGVATSMIAQVEGGSKAFSVPTLVRVARVLGVTTDSLLSESGAPLMPRALSQFLESGMAEDVTDSEVALLRGVMIPGRRLTAESYYLALKMIRAAEATDET